MLTILNNVSTTPEKYYNSIFLHAELIHLMEVMLFSPKVDGFESNRL